MMNRIELLAPAGDFASLKAAVSAGANAIYLGGEAFGARAYAKNFTREELKEAVHYAHLRNVRLFVTVNTLFKDEEFEQLIDYIDYLYDIQVDALLIQDIGLLSLVKKRYPDFEIHISTQMTLHSLEGARYFEDLGIKRVVLSRENTIEEIRNVVENTNLEVETFVHGALCVSYSGQCLMSAMIGDRSGNRGACAQPCRMVYDLVEDDEVITEKPLFLLSPRDLCTIKHIGEFIDAGVASLKIEGRMKRPEYVAAVVKAYRKAIDHYYDHSKPDYTEDDVRDMMQMFNRTYTEGYLFHDTKIVKDDFSGNHGIVIGEVAGYSRKKKRVIIQLNDTLNQGDSIVFEDIDKGRPVNKIFLKGKLVNQGFSGDRVEVEFDYPVVKGSVRKTVDKDTIERLHKFYESESKYRKIKLMYYAHAGQEMKLIGICDGITKEVLGPITEQATNKPTDIERVKKQLLKLGGTVYDCDEIVMDMDEDVFISIKQLNEMRRSLIEAFDKTFMYHKIHNGELREVSLKKNIGGSVSNIAVAYNIDQLECLLKYDIDTYYLYQNNLDKALELFKRYDRRPSICMPRINKDSDLEEIINNPLLDQVSKLLVNDYGAYRLFKDKEIILGAGFNIYNSYSAAYFKEDLIASMECDKEAAIKMKDVHTNIMMVVYGKAENMVSEHCVISQKYFHKKVTHCGMCKKHRYSLEDKFGKRYTVLTDEKCRNHILHHTIIKQPLSVLREMGGVLVFTEEVQYEIARVMDRYCIDLLENNK